MSRSRSFFSGAFFAYVYQACAMLVGLWQMDKEDLLAGMLLFRVLYYIAPFVLSVILLTFREVIIGTRSKRLRQAAAALAGEPQHEAVYVRERKDSGA